VSLVLHCFSSYRLPVPQYLELHKQAFGRPGAATAALNYYRAVNNPWRPTYKLYRQVLGNSLAFSAVVHAETLSDTGPGALEQPALRSSGHSDEQGLLASW
jgi:hypothetical protein